MSRLGRAGIDLLAVVLLVLALIFTTLVPGVRDTPLRIVIAIPAVTVLPGYAWTVAVFPRPDAFGSTAGDTNGTSWSHWIERTSLSIGLTIALVSFLAYGLALSPLGFSMVALVLLVAGLTLLGAGVAYARRLALSLRAPTISNRTPSFPGIQRNTYGLNALLAVAVIFAMISVGYGLTVPPDQDRFTEFYMVTDDGNGTLQADGYPAEIGPNASAPVTIGVNNFEHEPTTYTIVIRAIADDEAVELDRFTLALDHEEQAREPAELAPDIRGEDVQVQFLLYRDDVPASPHPDNAYRDTSIWTSAA